MESSIRKEGYQVPQVDLYTLENMDFTKKTSAELFNNKRVVVFSMVGAYTRVCSENQMLDIMSTWRDFLDLGIDNVYCISVNDCWVLNEWGNQYCIGDTEIKLISDANTYFTRTMGYLVNMGDRSYGQRSWRYAMVVNNGIIEKIFSEEGMCDEPGADPYEVTKPTNILDYLRG